MADDKKRYSLAEVLGEPDTVEIFGKEVNVYPLTITDMVAFMMGYKADFLQLYSRLDMNKTALEFADDPDINIQIMHAPRMFAEIIAVSTGDASVAPAVEKQLSQRVQLIALHQIWKISVPDPKRQADLLSEVMGKLLKLTGELKQKREQTPESDSAITSPQESKNLLPMATTRPM